MRWWQKRLANIKKTSSALSYELILISEWSIAKSGYWLVLFIWYQLVTNYNEDPVISDLLEEFDWYILPVMNPDGYEYSHTTVSSRTFYY